MKGMIVDIVRRQG